MKLSYAESCRARYGETGETGESESYFLPFSEGYVWLKTGGGAVSIIRTRSTMYIIERCSLSSPMTARYGPPCLVHPGTLNTIQEGATIGWEKSQVHLLGKYAIFYNVINYFGESSIVRN